MNDIDFNNKATLARMAGQIAAFFEPYPDEQAIEGIATHINKFWSPRMRGDLLAMVSAGDPALHSLVAKAMPKIRARRAG